MDFANYVILRALNKPINFFRKDKNFWVKKTYLKKNVFEYVFFLMQIFFETFVNFITIFPI